MNWHTGLTRPVGMPRRRRSPIAELALTEQLVAQYPNVPQYRVRLAGGLKYRGLLLEHAGKTREAADAFRREFDLDQALCHGVSNGCRLRPAYCDCGKGFPPLPK